MKKRALTILCAAFFCLGLPWQQTRAENPRGLPPDKLLTGRTFHVFIDSGSKVDESDEKNNLAGTVSGAPAEIDLKFNGSVYFHLGQPDSQAGAPGKPLKVKKSQLVGCRPGPCAMLTVRILKDPAKFRVYPDIKYKNLTTGYEADGTFTIAEGVASKDVYLEMALKDGENKVRFELDWKKRITEQYEDNNVLEVTVNLIVDQ